MTQNKPQVSHRSIFDIHAYKGGKSGSKDGPRMVKLSSNETAYGPSPSALTAYNNAASELHRYPDGAASELRDAIASVYDIPAERIVCGCGSDELINLLMHAYTKEGDEVVISQHGFLMYKIYAQSFGVTPVFAAEKNLRTDVSAMLAAVTPKTKMVCLANPNNPTGSYLTRKELVRLHTGLPPHVLLLIDGAYAEYAFHDEYSDGMELVAGAENIVVTRTFSKIYGLSALRVGWAYAPEAIVDVLNRIRSPFNINSPAIAAATAAVRDTAFTEHARQKNMQALDDLSKGLRSIGLTVHPSMGNFVLVDFGSAEKASAANAHLTHKGLIVRDVAAYGLPYCLRISIGLDEDNQAVINALREQA